jgi:hypothetical protein
MKLYRGIIDIGRSPVRNEVLRGFVPMEFNAKGHQVQVKGAKPRDPLTAPEVLVLRKMFGHDAVRELAEIGEAKELATQVRNRLETKYGTKVVESVFGIRGAMALPKALDLSAEEDNEPADDPGDPVDEEVVAEAPAKRPTLKLNREAASA